MMIRIAARLIPFSHLPGTCTPIPQTEWAASFFPNMVSLFSLRGALRHTYLCFPFRGPVRDFTASLDLEQGCVRVHGHSLDGYFRYRIMRINADLFLQWEKKPSSLADHLQDTILIEQCGPAVQAPAIRLSLGMHKQLEWDLAAKRGDLKEILPVLVRLSEWMPARSGECDSETSPTLLAQCQESVTNKKVRTDTSAFKNMLQAAFRGILTPVLVDDWHQGFASITEKKDALSLLSSLGKLVRSLFIHESADALSLLPCLPVAFASGRLLGIATAHGDSVDFEWSKKMLRKVIIKAAQNRELTLNMQKDLKTFRLRTSLRGAGRTVTCGAPLLLKAGQTFYLDRFCK